MEEIEQAVSEQRASRRKGIALCLSGGGYRAAIFHLGALRRLHEVGLLARVDTISSVSGGSIIAGFLADRLAAANETDGLRFDDWETEVAAPFRRFVARDLRTVPLLMHCLWNWRAPQYRARHLEHLYRRHLTKLTLAELPERPTFVFCATDLTFGVNWEFRRDRVGDWQAGYSDRAANWPVARAVAASSCFPPVFGPMSVELPGESFKKGGYRNDDRDALLARLQLSDGGLYDNMGLEPVWKSHAVVMVSDGGAPFEFEPGRHYLSRLRRYTGVVTNQARALRKGRLIYDFEVGKTYRGAYWSIGRSRPSPDHASSSPAGYSNSVVAAWIGKIRTDLDAFAMPEVQVLENHGYCEADRIIRKRLADLLPTAVPDAQPPHADLMNDEQVAAVLRHSASPFSPARMGKRLWDSVQGAG
jgi:NTE family protein